MLSGMSEDDLIGDIAKAAGLGRLGRHPPGSPITQRRAPLRGQAAINEAAKSRADFLRLPKETQYEGVVYFIQSVGGGPVKIGWSKQVTSRLRGLQTGHAERLTILAVLPATKETERSIHRALPSHRLHGEWFAPSVEVLALVEWAKNPIGPPPTDIVALRPRARAFPSGVGHAQ